MNSSYANRWGKKEVAKVDICRICKSTKLTTFLQLGPMPIPNGFLKKNELDKGEKFYPLDVAFCKNCGLSQLQHVVSPHLLFDNYLYIPSTAKTLVAQFKNISVEAINYCSAKKNDLAVDIGSNDGTLLKYFAQKEMRVLGIDPAINLAKKANAQGIKTLTSLFSKTLAQKIKSQYKKAKIITATNVLAHIDDLNDFFEGIKILLKDDGVFIAEFGYIFDILKKVEFDTIYHEHLSYFSLSPLVSLVKSHGLFISGAKRTDMHGGSLRVYITQKKKAISKSTQSILEFEKRHKLKSLETYLKYRKQVDKIRYLLVNLLWGLRLKNKRIVGYGASARGNVLLNYCRIGRETLSYIVDSIPYKQGRFTPGTHIPIYKESKLTEDKPDYVLILAWNFADEIIAKQRAYQDSGGKFILTTPKLQVI